jgi:hypothetical protein
LIAAAKCCGAGLNGLDYMSQRLHVVVFDCEQITLLQGKEQLLGMSLQYLLSMGSSLFSCRLHMEAIQGSWGLHLPGCAMSELQALWKLLTAGWSSGL